MRDRVIAETVRLPLEGLPLTAVEEHILLDDFPSHPMVIVSRFDFSGSSPPETLASAFDSALEQEPLLTARVQKVFFGRPRWRAGPVPALKRSTSHAASVQLEQQVQTLPRLDPYAGPMLHAEVIEHPAGWSIVLVVHHAACDGLGLVGFVERWLLQAENKPGRRRRRADDVMAALASRGRVASSWSKLFRMLPRLAKGLEGVAQFVCRNVIQINRHVTSLIRVPPAQRKSESKTWEPAVISMMLGPCEVDLLEAQASSQQVMVNDIMAAAMITSIGEWIDSRAVRPNHTCWIRLNIPMSLRTKSDHLLPAANRVSMVFLDRRPRLRFDRDQLIASVHKEMKLIRSHGLEHIFSLSIELRRRLPGGLRQTIMRPRSQSTAVFSNVGRCFHHSPLIDPLGQVRVGESSLEKWWIVPPVRPGTSIAVATHETSGSRMLSLQYDSDAISRVDATNLLEGMVKNLLGSGDGRAGFSKNVLCEADG